VSFGHATGSRGLWEPGAVAPRLDKGDGPRRRGRRRVDHYAVRR
jgi:hypothetical protein